MRSSMYRLMTTGLALVAVAGLCAVSFGDEDTTDGRYAQITKKRYGTYIGLAGGLTTGYGLSIRKWFGDTWGLQVNALPIYYEDNYDDPDNQDLNLNDRDSGFAKYGQGSLGLTYLRRLAEGKYVRVVFYAGGNWGAVYRNYDYHDTESEYNDSTGHREEYVVHKSGRSLKNTVSAGSGAGCEFYVWRFAFHAMVGLRGAYTIETESPKVGPSGEAGIHFRF